MYTIKTLNAISPVGLAKLPANQFEIDNEAAAPHGILVRSADMHDAPLPDSLLAIARAGAGTNNIPVEECTNAGIVVFNTPGANANAVAELVIGALVAGSRNMVDAVNWAQTLKGRDTIAKDVEKGKKAFVGPELRGKTLGVIGLGAIGARVANAAVALGMEVLGYDPYISIDAAWSLSRSVQHCVTLGDMLPRCDYLTIHVPYLPTPGSGSPSSRAASVTLGTIKSALLHRLYIAGTMSAPSPLYSRPPSPSTGSTTLSAFGHSSNACSTSRAWAESARYPE